MVAKDCKGWKKSSKNQDASKPAFLPSKPTRVIHPPPPGSATHRDSGSGTRNCYGKVHQSTHPTLRLCRGGNLREDFRWCWWDVSIFFIWLTKQYEKTWGVFKGILNASDLISGWSIFLMSFSSPTFTKAIYQGLNCRSPRQFKT